MPKIDQPVILREWVSPDGEHRRMVLTSYRESVYTYLRETDLWGTTYWVKEEIVSEEELLAIILVQREKLGGEPLRG